MGWLITIGVGAIACWFSYWLGFRQGQAHCERAITRILNKIAFRLGVPPEHEFWDRREWQQAVNDIKAELERQLEG